MNISLNWLRYYVDINVPVEELCDKMIMAGFEVESIVNLADSMSNVVAGKIEKIEKHPDADKLQICQVNVGKDESIQIVTGADNVFVGAIVPVALHNSHLPNGVDIKKGKLRGVVSEGMMCSGGELMLKDYDYPGAEVNGILILDDGISAGTDMREILDLNDYVIDFKITANRPDCQSALGVAREIAVVLGNEFKAPVPEYKTTGGNINDEIKVSVEDYELCPRYMGRAVKNLRIKESPKWLKLCLRDAGMRPINNIVDITNFVMLETGQPMHAFDKDKILGNQIIVRRAKDGEKITTLDEKEHSLTSEMLVIADGENPSCLAGIMGGENSEITESTSNLFLESAKFKRDNVRRTARSLGIRTESSARFEKGIDIIGTEYAMNRALQLIYDLDAGDIIDGTIDLNNGLPEDRKISVASHSINQLLGLEIPEKTMVDILNSLQIKTVAQNGVLNCEIPSYRGDVEGRADLAEEIMRIYGYDHIVGTSMNGLVVRGKMDEFRKAKNIIKDILVKDGCNEIVTYSIIGSKATDVLKLAENDRRRETISIINPLGDEYSTMRTQLVTSMLNVISTNIKRKNDEGRLFEISRLFIPKSLPMTEQPHEVPSLCIGTFGKNEDFFKLKGLVEDVLELFDLDKKVEYTPSELNYLHPTRQAIAWIDEEPVSFLGEIHPDLVDVDFDGRIYIAEVNLPVLFKITKSTVIYQSLPKFPAVTRDLALVCERKTPVAKLEKAIKEAAGKLLTDVKLFDVYEGSQIESDKKSVAYSITLQAPDRTLTDAECNEVTDKIIKKLKEIGATLRS